MPAEISQRAAAPEERAALEKLLASAPTAATRLKHGTGNALVLWAASLLGLIVVWLVLGWLAGKVLGINLGLRSTATLWVVGLATPACAVFAVISSARWVRNWADYRPQLRGDLAESRVNEERYIFTEAKRFQEPEHGGLVYFLRGGEDEVFTIYDHVSQALGVDGKDPLHSSYRPQSSLLIVRAPKSGFVLSSQASGATLNLAAPVELAVGPEEWPAAETLCNIPWDQLEAQLGSIAAVSVAPRSDA